MRLCTVVLWLLPCCLEPSWLYGKDGGPSYRSVKWHRALRGAERPEEGLVGPSHGVVSGDPDQRVSRQSFSTTGALEDVRAMKTWHVGCP